MEPLPVLIENSIQIAWDYLERTGEIEDAAVASRFLYDTIGLMIRRGEPARALQPGHCGVQAVQATTHPARTSIRVKGRRTWRLRA